MRRAHPRFRLWVKLALAGLGLTLAVSYGDYFARERKPRPFYSYGVAPWSMDPPAVVPFGLPSVLELNLPLNPYWIDDDTTGESENISSFYHGYGYPFRSVGLVQRFAMDVEPRDGDDRTWHPHWLFKGLPFDWSKRSGRFPIMPFPVGVVANTLLYALLLSMLISAPRRVIRSRRRRQGCCECCGYPRAGMQCPECGHAFS